MWDRILYNFFTVDLQSWYSICGTVSVSKTSTGSKVSMSLENKYRKWERYDVDEAIEKVDVSYRKNERKEERKMVEKEASRMRKIEAEILTAKERVRDLIAETGFRLRDRRRNKIPSISETSPKSQSPSDDHPPDGDFIQISGNSKTFLEN